MNPGLVELGWGDLALGATFIVVQGALSAWLRLGLGRRLAVATVRAVVQLTLLGFVLVPVFRWGSAAPVLGLCALMVLVAGRAAVRRVERRARGTTLDALAGMAVGAVATMALATGLVLRTDPWWAPRYLVPFLGMVLGNSLNGIALGIDRCHAGLEADRDAVELLLARGATWWEAGRPVAARALRTAMLPIVNTLSVVGIVSIPGMMTGQILGGTPPEQAARYQVLILFLIAGAVSIGSTVAVLLALRRAFDADGRLRLDRLRATGS